MNKEEILAIIDKQKAYFNEGNTLNVKKRIEALKTLKTKIKKYENEILEALNKDLGKSKTEAYMCEVGLVYSEISYHLKHIKKFTKKRKVHTPLAQFKAKSYEIASPYGNVLVMSPWNYPFLLSVEPVIEALASGNTVILKTSEYSIFTNEIIKKVFDEAFDTRHVSIIFGGILENQILLNTKFDYIFFTGSKMVGHLIYEAASRNMTPVTLELGGKSPCIVDETANIKLAAKRIVFGKLLNCGQTCVAPDYLLCKKEIHDELIKAIIEEIELQYGKNPIISSNFGKIITKRHFERIVSLIDKDKVIYGGEYNLEKLKIAPTIMDNVIRSDGIMSEEIFGPILPVLTYENIEEIKKDINSGETPLALYYFSTNKKNIEYVTNTFEFGGGCINDTIIHLATSNMPFGGFKESGLGAYHGKKGFDTFTHYKSIVNKANIIDLPMRYAPYKKINDKLIRKFLK